MKSIVVLILSATASGWVFAAEYDLSWHTIDSGGVVRSTADGFELSGTIGQPDAGVMAGGGFQLSGGFWFELVPGDCDQDGVAHLIDHELFAECLGGPQGGVLSGCECFDVDGSGHVDLLDFAITSQFSTGP